ncbi:DgaE family pyridoxal phosphate-dependent ammonia lyase [uncultured Traorella sp.]|uniref:DgaE family pyridoxal phosphate-dependent ammonia lyase n=1 Tax=uncultured Traorella sp. TaxID=1929048 RepID=UPI0025EE07DD|nr:DgaE family pyridoxal phosphate-dependent ammonia lyase [uncultured Traorella sp.]
MNIYEHLQVNEIINCSGKMTPYGSSILEKDVAESMKQASAAYVKMDDLMDKAGEVIAEICQGEAACVCAGASAGIILSVAAIITKGDPYLVEKVPFVETNKKDIIISCGHLVHFGATIHQMIQLGGGRVKEVGTVCKTVEYHYENAIDENTAAILYVKSHHASQTGQLPLAEVVNIAHKHHLPVILDAAAEEDLKTYLSCGCDLVVYSGAKAIGGPTSGFVVGKKNLIQACRKQYGGVARPMKVGKENIAGLIKAIENYNTKSYDYQPKLDYMLQEFNKINGINASLIKDSVRDIYRVKLTLDPIKTNMDAHELDQKLKNGYPVIFTRKYDVSNLNLVFDPRPMRDGDEIIVCKRVKEIIEGI